MVIEKPQSYIGSSAVIGLYLYSSVIWKYIDLVEMSPRHEYEVTSLNNMLLELGNTDVYELNSAMFVDCGTYENQLNAGMVVRALAPYIRKLVSMYTVEGSIWRSV